MKRILLTLVCLGLINLLYSQFDSKKYEALLNCGDSLFGLKEYKESARCYSDAINLRKDNAPRILWAASRSWTLANLPDSAFYYLELMAGEKRPTLPLFGNILSDTVLNTLHDDKRWQKFKNKMISNFRVIAMSFSDRIRSGYWTNATNDGFDAARAWAAADESDSAFFYLDMIINTDNNVFIDYPKLRDDKYLLSLHNDLRWSPLLEKLKKNWNWIRVKHSFTGPEIPMVATIDPQSKFLKTDGIGSYRHGVDKIRSSEEHGYNLEISGHRVWYQSGNRKDLSSRFMILDLNSPVKGTGSVAQGIIKDNDMELHVLYKLDTSVSPQVVYNFREIPVGSTVESDRTELNFYINNVLHTLTMGPWAFGRNNEPIAHNGKLSGVGTTKVLVTRLTETKYTISAPEGSIGRLWQTQNMTNPTDKGLFNTAFVIHLEKQ